MFLHNLKYTIKTLFKNKILIFWTFAFPIILGLFFNMAFSGIEDDEVLKEFDIAVINNDDFNKNEIYKETLKKLSEEEKIFNINYTSVEEANKLLDDSKIEGYVLFEKDTPKLVFKKNGVYQTVLKSVIEKIEENKTIITDIMSKNKNNDINNIINTKEIKFNNISNSNLSYMVIEFYTLIAMAAMYSGMIGLSAINNVLANMSSKGKRISVSCTKKSTIILSSLLASYLVSLIGMGLLLVFLIFILKINFGLNILLVLFLSALGSLAGISFGIFLGSTFKMSEGGKVGIVIAISMFFAVLSGMMGVTLKYVIDKNIPILNMINPNNLITDGFYSLYYYSTYDRYFRDVICLLIFTSICLIISFINLRREKYDSI